MKLKRASTAMIAILAGAAVFTTSALADVIVGSGYHSLKNAAKTTMAALSGEVDSFTVKTSVRVLVDGKTVDNGMGTALARYDNANRRQEKEETDADGSVFWTYRDDSQSIYKGGDDETYHVTRFREREREDENEPLLDNPFQYEMAGDVEKIVDAFVGNLKDNIQVEESADKRQYIGNLSEGQVPSLVNAVFSFVMKYTILDSYEYQELGIPEITGDVYLKGVSGRAMENGDGLVESIFGTIEMAGSDAAGQEHTFAVEMVLEVTDIDTTIVEVPDLTDKKVSVSQAEDAVGYTFDQKYIGVYKNDIVIDEETAFTKVGERVVEITAIEDNVISGRYYEVYADGYAPEVVPDFTFSGTDVAGQTTEFTYTDADGSAKIAVMHRMAGSWQNIIFEIGMFRDDEHGYLVHPTVNERYGYYNSEFVRQFDEEF